jgi:predicted nucleic acid-binding protein
MPISGNGPDVLVDTSAAVALVVADHTHHEAVFTALRTRRIGLSGHAAFETFSVLTRLPSPARLTPAAASRLLGRTFPLSRFLSAVEAAKLLASLAARGVAGGAVYDALVGAAAKQHGIPLATRDLRALQTYRALDVEVEIIGNHPISE